MDAASRPPPPPGTGVRVRAPLVESVSCYCRLDTGLKTVVDARKFVPGAKMCMQPEVKQNKRKSRGSRKERCRTQAPLLPGLPDDLAIACLIRVPRVEHPNLRMVCKRWNRLLSGNYFYSLLPSEYSEALGFGCAVLSGCYLYLFGGKDPLRGIQRTLQSAEVYDPNRNRWACITEMNNGMVPFIGVVYDGKWFLKGLDSHRQVTSEVYLPSSNAWDGCKLRVYDDNTGTWTRFMDSKHHLGSALRSWSRIRYWSHQFCTYRLFMHLIFFIFSLHEITPLAGDPSAVPPAKKPKGKRSTSNPSGDKNNITIAIQEEEGSGHLSSDSENAIE
ncbi:F-box/kelch-repeat protein [Dichanthelium oligosanthes]|uniref:F-box/kelch-repeat protein n=1 Tax=Dichanthelium oligosanthes TaxID=888268 RepID=A0A1E5VG57_9POAL|nr:F-box/kelch-repeat protein [Dichanthelium oligosanthes]